MPPRVPSFNLPQIITKQPTDGSEYNTYFYDPLVRHKLLFGVESIWLLCWGVCRARLGCRLFRSIRAWLEGRCGKRLETIFSITKHSGVCGTAFLPPPFFPSDLPFIPRSPHHRSLIITIPPHVLYPILQSQKKRLRAETESAGRQPCETSDPATRHRRENCWPDFSTISPTSWTAGPAWWVGVGQDSVN